MGVTVEGGKLDRYGRLLGKVIANSVDCNLRQINQGLAWHYKKYIKEQSQVDQLTYTHAEDDARSERAGLWVDSDPVPP